MSEAIAEEQQRRADGVVSGNIEGFDRYRFECGFLQGLQWVADQAERIVRESHAAAEGMDVVTEGEE